MVEIQDHNQFVVTFWKDGGEHQDHNRQFDNWEEALAFAKYRQADPEVRRVELKSRKVKMSSWAVHTIR